MSQYITFLQYDETSVEERLQQNVNKLKSGDFLLFEPLVRLITRSVDNNGKVDEEELQARVATYCDGLVHGMSYQRHSENIKTLYPFIDFWLRSTTSQKLEDYNGDFEQIEQETWQKVFSSPLTLREIEEAEWSSLVYFMTTKDVLDLYLSIKKVYDFSYLTDTEMWVFHEDHALSPRWTTMIEGLYEEIQPFISNVITKKREKEAEALKPPPFAVEVLKSKEFFIPRLFTTIGEDRVEIVYKDTKTGEIQEQVWSGKVAPGQTYQESIRDELHDTLNYGGDFKILRSKETLDPIEDKSGQLIKKYRVKVVLEDSVNFDIRVFDYKLATKKVTHWL